MRKPAAVLAAVLLLAGCQNAPPQYARVPAMRIPPSPEEEEQAPKPPPSRPIPSYTGTAGPLAHAGIGHYMDAMEKDLRRILHGTPVARPGDALLLNLRNDTIFEKSGRLSGEGSDLLQALAAVLRHYDRTTVQVSGFTDTRGLPDASLKVSQKRADTVAAALRADGVQSVRLAATGFGQTRLKVATGPDKAEPRNRRVEIKILPHPS
ncbi:MAG: OmpA family protein [Alphaproteobacteria bacterium]|nr:OmpA family protein [Alphaproteobacteria bacterium]